MARRYTVLLVVLFVVLDAAAVLFLRYRMSIPPEPPAQFEDSDAAPVPGIADDNPISGLLFLAGAADGHVLRMTRGGACVDDGQAPSATATPTEMPTTYREAVPATAWVALPGADAEEVALPGGLVETLGIGYDEDADRWWVVGTDAACAVAEWSGGLAGTSWERSEDETIERWVVDPLDDTSILTPRGPLSLGSDCHATSALVAGPSAYAVCDDGRVLETLREEREFAALDRLEQVTALAVRDDQRTAAITRDSDCAAGLLRLRTPGGPQTSDQCLGNSKAGLGVTWAGDELVVQLGYDLMVDENGTLVARG